MKQIGPRQTPGPDCVQGRVAQPRRTGLTGPPGSGRFPAAHPSLGCRTPPCSGRFPVARLHLRRRTPLSDAAHPNFWIVSQENGPEFDASPEFWAVSPALRCDSCWRSQHNPRLGAPASSASRSAAYETAQNFACAIETACSRLAAWGNRARAAPRLALRLTKPPRTSLARLRRPVAA